MLAAALALAAAAAAPAALPACTAAGSAPATIERIEARPDRYLDRCVTVRGYVAGIRMYDSREGLYLTYRYGPDGNRIPANLHHRIGIDKQEIRNLRLHHPVEGVVTGRVDSCERRVKRVTDAGGIPFLGGYCHYDGGPTIVVSTYRLGTRSIERMTGEAARARFGNIVPIPADWPFRKRLEQMAADFTAALRSRDRAKLASLHDVDPRQPGESDRDLLSWLLDDPDSVFARFRSAAPSETKIFVNASADGRPFRHDEIAAILCICRERACGGRWPISGHDADNGPQRPYACTRVEPRDWVPAGAGLNTPRGEGFLLEPRRTAYRAGLNSTRQ
jgi:hypothetical protein